MSDDRQIIRILGKRFTFDVVPCDHPLEIVNDGIIRKNKGQIAVSAGMNFDRHGEVVIHECLHEINDAMFCGLDESQVHRIAAGLWCLFADNKEFFTGVLGYEKEPEPAVTAKAKR